MKLTSLITLTIAGLASAIPSLEERQAGVDLGEICPGGTGGAGGWGICEFVSHCTDSYGGTSVSDVGCPGPSSEQCCEDIYCDSDEGLCLETSVCHSEGGTPKAGLCPGPSNFECCIF